MYMINVRADGIDGNAFAEAEQLFDLGQGGQIKQISEAELMQAVEQKNILIIVHGFYRPIADVLSFYVTMEQYHQDSLSAHYDAIVGFIWPGGESKFDYYHSTQYVRKTGSIFRKWMHHMNYARCTIDVMSHGMGSLVIYHSLQISDDFTIRNIFTIGAGIPQEVITNVSYMDRVRNRVKNFYVFYIEKDHSPEDRLPETEALKPLAYSERVNWEEQLTRMDNISLVNITELISHYTGYQSLTVVTEFIGTLLSGRQYPVPITLNEVKESISKSLIKK